MNCPKARPRHGCQGTEFAWRSGHLAGAPPGELERSPRPCCLPHAEAIRRKRPVEAGRRAARAWASLSSSRAPRYKPLAEMEAVSKQDYTDAVAQARQADAAVAQNSAALQSAQINLRFT